MLALYCIQEDVVEEDGYLRDVLLISLFVLLHEGAEDDPLHFACPLRVFL